MCKFNNRLFIFVSLIGLSKSAQGFPLNGLIDSTYDDYDYDLHYNQRQNGTENYRISLNGFLVAFPAEEESDTNNYTDELINILGSDFLGSGKLDSSHQSGSETNKHSYYEKDHHVVDNEKHGTHLDSLEQSMDKNEQLLQKSAEVTLQRSKSNKKRKFQIVNLLKLLRRRDDD